MPPWANDVTTFLGRWSAQCLDLLANGLNSNFGVAFIGAAAGGLAGAWAAQAIAVRSERRTELKQEISATNAAVNLAAGIVNSHAALKRQMILPMIDDLNSMRKEYFALRAKSSLLGYVNPALKPELKLIRPVQTPIDNLRNIVFNQISADTFTLSVYQLLFQALDKVQGILNERNTLIDELRNLPPPQNERVLYTYLGVAQPGGRTDERYPTLAQALLLECDDVIMFGKALAEHLAGHSKASAKRYGRHAPMPVGVNFVRLAQLGLLPDPKHYEGLFGDLHGRMPT